MFYHLPDSQVEILNKYIFSYHSPASQIDILNKYIISYHRWPEFHQYHPEEEGIHLGRCRSKLDTSVLQDHLNETDPVNGQAHGQEQ